MDRSTVTRMGIAGAIAGVALSLGGVAIASAESDSAGVSASASAHPGGPRGDRGDRGQMAEALAQELGLDQDKVQQALEAVREDLRPDRADAADGSRPAPPTEAERAEHQAALAKALAEELGVSEATVSAALDAVHEQAEADRSEHRAEARDELVTRLDDAVNDGTLTAADKASVLKAFDAEVIGGGHGEGPRGGGPAPSGAAS